MGKKDRGVLLVKFQGKWGITDIRGTEILPPIYDELIDLELYILERDKKYYVFNPTTRKLSTHAFEEVYTERVDRSLVKLNGRYGYLDRSGEIIIQPVYENATNFEVQRAAVSRDGKWGFIDSRGVEITSIIYEQVRTFTFDLAPVKLNGKWGFVDQSGQNIIAPQYIDIQQGFYENPVAVVRVQVEVAGILVLVEDSQNASRSMVCLIDKKGMIVSAAFDEINGPDGEAFRVKINGKYGFIDMTGKSIVPCLYQDAERFYQGKVKVMKDNSWYYLHKNGKKL